MTRRALGRGRLLVVLGSLVAIAGLFPTWWRIERTNLSDLSGNGFQGIGVIVFLGCLTMLALVTLPFASSEGRSSLDRAAAYVLVGVSAISAFLWRMYEISQFSRLGLPMDAPGLWITGAGLLVVAWGVGDIVTERPRDY